MTRPPLSDTDRAILDRRRTLELTRVRAAADLDRATVPAHRRMLQQALQAINDQLAQLG